MSRNLAYSVAMKKGPLSLLLVFLMYLSFACVFVSCKKCLEVSSPLFFVGSRAVVAGLGILLASKIFGQQAIRHSRGLWIKVGLLGLLAIYATNALESYSLQHLIAAKVSLCYSLSPFVAAVLSYFLFKERLSKIQCLGMVIGVAGVTPIFLHQLTPGISFSQFIGCSWPELSMLGAVAFSVYGWILLAQVVRSDAITSLQANGLSMLIGGLMALVHSRITEDWNPLPVTDGSQLAVWSGITLILSNVIGYNLFGYLLKRYSNTFLSLAGLMTPFLAALVAFALLGEIITWHFLAAAATIAIGLVIFSLPRKAQPVDSLG